MLSDAFHICLQWISVRGISASPISHTEVNLPLELSDERFERCELGEGGQSVRERTVYMVAIDLHGSFVSTHATDGWHWEKDRGWSHFARYDYTGEDGFLSVYR